MLRLTITEARIANGSNNRPAIEFKQSDNCLFCSFSVGSSVYDKNAENNRRWVNIAVKAFNGMAKRIQQMNLQSGQYISVTGRFDLEPWTDSNGQQHKQPTLTVDEIEYWGRRPQENGGTGAPQSTGGQQSGYGAPPAGQSGAQYAAPPSQPTSQGGYNQGTMPFPSGNGGMFYGYGE